MFENLIYSYGYAGIFVVCALSSSLFPLGSEIFVVLMITLGYNIWLILLFATLGNYLGSLSNYYVGKYGNKFLFSKHIKINQKTQKKVEKVYLKYGAPILFFSWVPIIGDPLCVIPGIFDLDIKIFSFWVILGKLFRYIFIILITLAII